MWYSIFGVTLISSVVLPLLNPNIIHQTGWIPRLVLVIQAFIAYIIHLFESITNNNPPTSSSSNSSSPKVIIIGAGFGGISAAYSMKKAGIPFIVLEKGSSAGGVWAENTYPGAACDVYSHLYSFSFEPNPPWGWSRLYAPQEEIKRYIQHCAEKFQLLKFMRFNTQVEELIWDLERKVWTAKCSNDFVVEAPFVISAVGQLNRPLYPKGIGLDEIDPRKMTVFHSSSWDHKCDLKGKRVAIVGNGASALQFSPHVIDQAKEVLIFYRSSSYYLPKWDSAVPKYIRKLLLSFPILNRLYRYFIYLLFDIRSPMLLNTAKEWQKWITEHTFIAYMKGKLKREDLRKSLIPDYVVGCKRVLLDDRYLEAIQSENVKMVQESVSKISNNSITTNAGNTFENIDVVIFGTGFDSISFLAPIKILGKDKTDLHAQWDGSPSAYFGLAVPNFPNFFLTYGPHTNLGHSSIVFMMECQTEYAAAMISHCLDSGKKSFELKQSSYDAYMKIFEKRIAKTVFAGNCSSWYKNKDGKVVNNWYGSCTEYWLLLRSPDYNAYNFQ